MTTSELSSLSQGPGGVTFKHGVALGKRLIEALSDQDLTSRWVAHHVGQLIADAESATSDGAADAGAKQRACLEGIMLLWEHRAVTPGRQPFPNLRAIGEAIEALTASDAEALYRTRQPHPVHASADVIEALDAAEAVRSSARSVVAALLRAAARQGSGDDQDLEEYLHDDAPELRLQRLIDQLGYAPSAAASASQPAIDRLQRAAERARSALS